MLTLFRNVTFLVVKDITVTLAAKIAGVSSPRGDPSSDAGAGHQAWGTRGWYLLSLGGGVKIIPL